MNEKKFHEMLENEKRMYNEIEILKNENLCFKNKYLV